jgi:acyl-CoA synthetase (AMP-forming)/AMP-acid ligase II
MYESNEFGVALYYYAFADERHIIELVLDFLRIDVLSVGSETAPLITFANYDKYKIASCGPVVDHMEAKVVSPDPANVPGELIAKGMNVMLGYYKKSIKRYLYK